MELDAMAFLNHPNLVSLHDFFMDDENYYLVLDYCEGGDLAQYLVTQQLREPLAAAVFQQIVSAIDFCHSRGVAHRDLKLQNVLITTFPTVKVTDFGLSGHFRGRKLSTFCGSVCYAAPECLNLIQYDGELSDMWSLGVILYELATGNSPWNTGNLPAMIAEIKSGHFTVPSSMNPQCADLIRKLLKIKPADRIKCDGVLAHPWLKVAVRTPGRSLLPRLGTHGVTLLSVVESFDRPPDALVSPFDAVAKEDTEDVWRVAGAKARPAGGSRKAFAMSAPIPGSARTPRRGVQFALDRKKASTGRLPPMGRNRG
jgi:serine/threonine protein kinase